MTVSEDSLDNRMRKVEVQVARVEQRVNALETTVKWGLGIVAGMLISGFGTVLALLITRK